MVTHARCDRPRCPVTQGLPERFLVRGSSRRGATTLPSSRETTRSRRCTRIRSRGPAKLFVFAHEEAAEQLLLHNCTADTSNEMPQRAPRGRGASINKHVKFLFITLMIIKLSHIAHHRHSNHASDRLGSTSRSMRSFRNLEKDFRSPREPSRKFQDDCFHRNWKNCRCSDVNVDPENA